MPKAQTRKRFIANKTNVTEKNSDPVRHLAASKSLFRKMGFGLTDRATARPSPLIPQTDYCMQAMETICGELTRPCTAVVLEE